MRSFTRGLALLGALTLAACGGGSTPAPSTTPVTYAVGDFRINSVSPSLAGYWRGTTRVALPPLEEGMHCFAEDIEVRGSDVYACGECFVSNTMGGKPVYWKNGTIHDLPRQPGTEGIDNVATAIALTASGEPVIAGGAGNVGDIARPAIWRTAGLELQSEAPRNFPQDDPGAFLGGVIRDLKIVDGHEYAIGFLMYYEDAQDLRMGHARATFWIDGEAWLVKSLWAAPVDGTPRDSIGTSVSVSGSLMYMAADLFVVTDAQSSPPTMRSQPTPMLYRREFNGSGDPVAVPSDLYQGTDMAYIERVVVEGGMVYATGSYYEGILTTPSLWTFVDRTRLPMVDPILFGEATGLARHGGKTYATGVSFYPTPENPLQMVAQPMLWVDGVATLLEMPSASTVPFAAPGATRAHWGSWAGTTAPSEKDTFLGGIARGIRVQDE